MKTNPFLLSRLLLAFPALVPFCAYSQDAPRPGADANILRESADDEVAVATGTIFSLDADSVSLTPEKSPIPLVFETTATTPMVDEQDKVVPRDLVRKGIAATVHYTTLGEKFLATKITVTRETLTGSTPADPTGAAIKRAELTETKAMKDEAARAKASADGGGTLMGFEQILTVRAPGETGVTQYTVNNSTLYVDSAGNPVPPHAVRTGVGLSVQFVEDGGRKIATRVTIRSMPAWVRQGLLAAEGRSPAPGIIGATRGRDNKEPSSIGNIADGFIYPQISSLPSNQSAGVSSNAANSQPGANGQDVSGSTNQNSQSNQSQTGANNQLNPNGQPGQTNPPTQPSGENQPNGDNNPNGDNQPGAKGQPGQNNKPNTGRPGAGKPATPARSSPSTPSQPSTSPATPGAR